MKKFIWILMLFIAFVVSTHYYQMSALKKDTWYILAKKGIPRSEVSHIETFLDWEIPHFWYVSAVTLRKDPLNTIHFSYDTEGKLYPWEDMAWITDSDAHSEWSE